MFGFDRIWYEITRELSELSREFIIWVERLSDAEKIIALCVFIIALFLLTVRLAGGKKRDRSETVQFVFAMALMADIIALQSAAVGSPEATEIADRMAKAMTESLMFIGTVQAPAPIYRNNDLINFADFKTHSYEYYRTYPYRASQWWLDE